MAALHFQYDDFYNVIKHHIALISRFDSTIEKEFSIAFLSVHEKDSKHIADAFSGILRETDIIFNYEHFYLLFLPATDWNGTDMLISELCDFLDQQRKDTIVTYPSDGKNAIELIAKLEDVIQKDYGIVLQLND
ncbi:MAG: hypothetical protein ACQESH_01920 [Campylobacterota bacterium]